MTDINEVATATLEVKGYPNWIKISKDAVWISNSGLNLLQRIDPKKNRIIAEIAVNEPCAAFTIGLARYGWPVVAISLLCYGNKKHQLINF